jgi:hypothetical protein
MIYLRYIDPNGDAIETGEFVEDVNINLSILQDNKYQLIIRYHTMLRTGKLDFICPVADEIHIVLNASREDTGMIIDAIRTAIRETRWAVVDYSNARSHAIHMTDDKDASIFDQEHKRPNKHVDLNQVLSPWL